MRKVAPNDHAFSDLLVNYSNSFSVEQLVSLNENPDAESSVQQLVALNSIVSVQQPVGLKSSIYSVPGGHHVVIINKIKR